MYRVNFPCGVADQAPALFLGAGDHLCRMLAYRRFRALGAAGGKDQEGENDEVFHWSADTYFSWK